MANVKLYLKRKDTDGLTAINLFLSADGIRYKLSTGESVHPKYWDEKNQKVKTSHPEDLEINSNLKDVVSRILKEYRKLKEGDESFTQEEVKEKLIKVLKPKDKLKKVSLLEVFETLFTDRKDELKKDTIKSYKSLYNHLKAFQEHSGSALTFEKINPVFEDKFKQYLINQKQLLNNSINKYIKNLKAFMKWAAKYGHHKSEAYKEFKAEKSKTGIIALTFEEFLKVLNFDFSENTRLARVRDLFCFQCCTGQRFSDINKFRWIDIIRYPDEEKPGEFLYEWHLFQYKGNKPEKVIIPLSEYALTVLNKYKKDSNKKEDMVFKSISNQKANKYLKEMLKVVGINDEFVEVKYSGKKRIEKRYLKYEKIGTHTARATFITISREKGMRPETIMGITRHEDYRTMKLYLNVSEKMKRDELKSAWG